MKKKFKSLSEFVLAVKVASEGTIDPRLKRRKLKPSEEHITQEQLLQMMRLAYKLDPSDS